MHPEESLQAESVLDEKLSLRVRSLDGDRGFGIDSRLFPIGRIRCIHDKRKDSSNKKYNPSSRRAITRPINIHYIDFISILLENVVRVGLRRNRIGDIIIHDLQIRLLERLLSRSGIEIGRFHWTWCGRKPEQRMRARMAHPIREPNTQRA